MRRRTLLALLPVAACYTGGAVGPGPRPQAGSASPSLQPAPPRAQSAPSTAQASSATAAAAPAPEARTRTLLVEVEGLGLFGDERREAEALVEAWAAKAGLVVVPVERAATVFARARLGQHADTGQACGRPLARWRAQQRWQGALGIDGELRASVACKDGGKGEAVGGGPRACTLSVAAYDEVDFGGAELLRRVAPIDPALPWREALPAALAALAPPPAGAGDGYGFGGLLGSLASGVVTARPERLAWSTSRARETDSAEHDAFRDGLSLAKGRRPLRACFQQDGANPDLLVEVDARGKVARCESRETDDAVSRCACAAFTAHARAKPALRGRRAFVHLSFSPADAVTPWRGVVTASTNTHLDSYRDREGRRLYRPRVSDRSIEGWRPPSDHAVARCFLDVREPGTRDARVTVHFDAQGTARAVEVASTNKGAPLTDAQTACVQRAFATATAPCPAAPSTSAHAMLRVTVRRIGDKIASPLELDGLKK